MLSYLRFKWAYLKWFLATPGYKMGSPLLGKGKQREINRAMLRKRYWAREPRREDF